MKSIIFCSAVIALTAITTYWAPVAHAQKTVRIHDYPGLGNFLVRVANANGLCEKQGIKCELRPFNSGSLGLQTLMGGDIEIALPTAESTIQLANKGADIKVIGSGARSPVYFLIAAAGMDLPNKAKGYPTILQDFKGKKIGVNSRGSGSEYALKEMLLDAGMKIDDVTVVAVGAPNTAMPAIVNKQVDAMLIFTPMDGMCVVSKACTVLVDTRKGQGPTNILKGDGASLVSVVRGDWAAKNPDVIAAYIKAMQEAETIAQNPANFNAMLKIAQATFQVAGEGGDKILEIAMRNALSGYRFSLDTKALQHIAQYNFQIGQIDKLVDTSKLLYAR